MLMHDYILERIGLQRWKNFYARHSKTTNNPLVERAELVAMQELANAFTWQPGSFREVAHPVTGNINSVYLGSGMDYEESRPYVSGDDIRFMNWRLSARTGQPYMKVFREEKRPSTFILLDKRASMRFGNKQRLKVSQAIRLASYIAFSARKRQCGVSGVIVQDNPGWIDNCNDDGCVYHFLNEAAETCLPAYLQENNEPTLDYMIKLVQKIVIAGSDVCLVSDFTDITDDSRAALLQLSLECNVTAIHVYADTEDALPAAGKLYMHDKSIRDGVLTDSNNAMQQEAYARNIQRKTAYNKQLFDSLGIPYIRIAADDDNISDRMMERV